MFLWLNLSEPNSVVTTYHFYHIIKNFKCTLPTLSKQQHMNPHTTSCGTNVQTQIMSQMNQILLCQRSDREVISYQNGLLPSITSSHHLPPPSSPSSPSSPPSAAVILFFTCGNIPLSLPPTFSLLPRLPYWFSRCPTVTFLWRRFPAENCWHLPRSHNMAHSNPTS